MSFQRAPVRPMFSTPAPGFGWYAGQQMPKTSVRAKGVKQPFLIVLPNESTQALASRARVTVDELINANPNLRTQWLFGRREIVSLSPGDRVLLPRALGNPCNPGDDDFDIVACAESIGGGGGGGETGPGGGGGGGGGYGDGTTTTTTDDGGGGGSSEMHPGDPTGTDPGTLPPWITEGVNKCAKKNMDYDPQHDVCSPKGVPYGPHGEAPKGSVPVDATPGGGTTTPKPKTTPSTPPVANVVTSGKGMTALKWAGGILAVAAVAGGVAYVATKKKKGKNGEKK